jgi:oligopeptide/dipeptide ABC transporter ATP-binding protein
MRGSTVAPRTDDGNAPARVPVLRVRDLKTWFMTDAGPVRAVDGVSLTVHRGETLAVVGESGSGKSVTGLTVMRLLGRTTAKVMGGEVLFTGKDGRERDLLHLSEDEMQEVRGGDIAMIFQDPMSSLNPVFTVGDQIAESIQIHQRRRRAEALRMAEGLLAQVGIADPARRVRDYPHQMSGGMRQRVMIAMALACDPVLLLADEPTTALDVTIQSQIMRLLKALQTERQMGMIFVSHDLGLVAEIADRIAVMYAGQVVEEGDADGVLNSPRHPYTRALLRCIPHRDYAAPEGRPVLTPIPGTTPSLLDPPQGCRFSPRCEFAIEDCRAGPIPLEDTGQGRTSRCIRWRVLR